MDGGIKNIPVALKKNRLRIIGKFKETTILRTFKEIQNKLLIREKCQVLTSKLFPRVSRCILEEMIIVMICLSYITKLYA